MGIQFGAGQVTLKKIDTEEVLLSFNATSMDLCSETVELRKDRDDNFDISKEATLTGKINYLSPKMMELMLGVKLGWHQKLRMHIINFMNTAKAKIVRKI